VTKSERQKIIDFVKTKSWSFQLVADHFGITRCQVAGIVFRDQHPYEARVKSPNSTSRNKIGTGRHGPGLIPLMTASNTR
jgi:hypothetical protein